MKYGPRILSPIAADAARDRILAAAYDLFSRRGIRAVGVDAIISHAGVAKMTFYHHFPSKDELVLAFMDRREEVWTNDWLEGEIRSRASDPADRLVVTFDVMGEWFRRKDYENCSFVRTLLEEPEASNPINAAARTHMANIRAIIADLAREAAIPDPEDFAWKWTSLMKGALIATSEGDQDAAARAKEVALLLLQHSASTSSNGGGRN